MARSRCLSWNSLQGNKLNAPIFRQPTTVQYDHPHSPKSREAIAETCGGLLSRGFMDCPPKSVTVRAFRSACGSLRHVGLSCPPAHGQFSDGPPRVGVFIVPNGTDDGMLETLCLHSVSTLPEFPCVDAYFQCLQAHQIAPKSLHKARAHAWLASRPEPDRRVGEAAQAGYWPWNSQAFDNLWAFLRSM